MYNFYKNVLPVKSYMADNFNRLLCNRAQIGSKENLYMRHSSGVLMVGSPKIEKNAVNYILPCTSLISDIRESSMNVIFTGPSTSEGNDF